LVEIGERIHAQWLEEQSGVARRQDFVRGYRRTSIATPASRARSRRTSTSSAIMSAPRAPANLSLIEMRERLIDDWRIALKPPWTPYRNHPVSFAMVWQSDLIPDHRAARDR
jgi:hypothetical protein